MTTCNAEWHIDFEISTLFTIKHGTMIAGRCRLPLNHEGKHLARTRSNVDNSVAQIRW